MMFSLIGLFLVLVVMFAVFLFFARRILRLALKLAFVGAILVSLFAGGVFGWWRGWFSQSSTADHAIVNSNQRPNSNRRHQ